MRPKSTYQKRNMQSMGEMKKMQSAKFKDQGKIFDENHLYNEQSQSFTVIKDKSPHDRQKHSSIVSDDIRSKSIKSMRPQITCDNQFSRAALNRDINTNLSSKNSNFKKEFETRKFEVFLNDYFQKQKSEINRERAMKLYPIERQKIGLIDYVNKVYIDPTKASRKGSKEKEKSERPKFVSYTAGREWKNNRSSFSSNLKINVQTPKV